MQKILYIGMDVHQASIVIVVLNVDGKTISEAIIETKTETVRDFIRGLLDGLVGRNPDADGPVRQQVFHLCSG